MNITVIGRGNVGGGLVRLWKQAGHNVTAIGKDGGDASAADVIVVAVPSGAIADALAAVSGIEGRRRSTPRMRSPAGTSSSSHSPRRSSRSLVGRPRRPSTRTT